MIGKIIAELRKAKGLTQEGLAKELGLTESAIQKYELGKMEPRAAVIKKMAEYFGVTTDLLLETKDCIEDEENIIFLSPGLSQEDKKRIREIVKTFK